MKKIIVRYDLAFFFLLTYLLSWWAAPFTKGALIPYGPAIAAVIVTALTSGRQGLRKYWSRLTNWRAGWWYLIAPAIVISYTGIAYVINVRLGATVLQTPHWISTGVFWQLLFLGGQWEEPGWTGYALPRMRERFAGRSNGSLSATLMVGVFRAIWHLPLFLYGKMPWFDIFVFSFAFQIIIAWLYDQSGGSVPVVMVLHFTSNLMGAVMAPVFAGLDRLTFLALFMSLATLLAITLVGTSQMKWRRKKAVAA
jgi:uncharacterized protein